MRTLKSELRMRWKEYEEEGVSTPDDLLSSHISAIEERTSKRLPTSYRQQLHGEFSKTMEDYDFGSLTSTDAADWMAEWVSKRVRVQ